MLHFCCALLAIRYYEVSQIFVFVSAVRNRITCRLWCNNKVQHDDRICDSNMPRVEDRGRQGLAASSLTLLNSSGCNYIRMDPTVT